MKKRSLPSAFIAIVFMGLSITGIWLIVSKAEHWVILLHVVLGLLFLTGALVHLK